MSDDNDSIDEAFWAIVRQLETPTPAAALNRLACRDFGDWVRAEVDGALHMWTTALAW